MVTCPATRHYRSGGEPQWEVRFDFTCHLQEGHAGLHVDPKRGPWLDAGDDGRLHDELVAAYDDQGRAMVAFLGLERTLLREAHDTARERWNAEQLRLELARIQRRLAAS